MTTLSQTIGLTLWIVTLGLLWLTASTHRPRNVRLGGGLIIIPLAFLVRGSLGELSFLAPALAWMIYLKTTPHRPQQIFLLALALTELALAASALGFMEWDIYALGYSPRSILAAFALALAVGWKYNRTIAIGWLIGLTLYATGATVTQNLWDIFIDFPSMILAGFLLKRHRASPQPDQRPV